MEILIIFLPLFGFLFTSFFNNSLNIKLVNYIPSSLIMLCCFYSFYLFFKIFVLNQTSTFYISSWITSGNFNAKWSFDFDILTSVMMIVVTTISLVVHIYSIKYIENNPFKPMFMGYLSLSTFSMLVLVSSNNLLQFFLGWQLVGFSSFLLVGHLNNKIAFNKAAIKLFIVNRLSDLGIILSLVMTYAIFDSISFEEIFEMVPVLRHYNFNIFNFNINGVELISTMILFSAVIRSAQLFFYLWSSDPFEVPIPILTLLYSSTLIPAGIFVLLRFSPFLEYAELALNLLIIIGSITTVFLTSIAITEFNLKRIIIYASCSQLGLIIIAIGISAYNAAFFHFINFAFFNSLLFLLIGSIIRSLGYKNDIRKMGALYSKLPFTFILMYVGTFSIVGIPFFSGFYSKETIVALVFISKSHVSLLAFISILFSSFLIAFVFWRVIFLIFHGEFKGEINQFNKVREPSLLIMISILSLAVMAVFSGWVLHDFFVGTNWSFFWVDSLFVLPGRDGVNNLNIIPSWIKLFPILLTIIGIGLAILLYLIMPGIPSILKEKLKPFYLLSYKKWYLNEFSYFFFIKPSKFIFNSISLLVYVLIAQDNFVRAKKSITIKSYNFFLQSKIFYRKFFFLVFVSFFLLLLSFFYIDMVFRYDF